ncbi:MAG: hypothetical protein ACR2GL_05555 [Thermoleophilaceae bacterium]
MGVLGDMLGSLRMKDPVRGTAQVVSCSGHRGRGVMQRCRMRLVVRGDRIPAKAIEHSGLVHRTRWPAPGMTLPVTIDRADPTRVKVAWDEVESSRERADRGAEELAATMRDDGDGSDAGAPP